MRTPSLRRSPLLPGAGPLLAAVVLVALSAGCNQGRSRAQLSSIERTLGNAVIEWTFEYDDDGRLEEVRIKQGEDVDVVAYEYDDSGVVTEIAVTNDDGNVYVHELEWEDGRIVEKRESGANVTARTEVEYDDQGRPSRADKLTEIGTDYREERVRNFDYDDEGRLEQWLETVTTTIEIIFIGDVVSTVAEERELEFDDDTGDLEVVRLSRRADDNVTITEAEFDYDADTGRLASVIDTDNDEGDLDYDDEGRIEEIDFRDTNDRYSFSYEEGSASGVILEPLGLPYSFFFDLTGRPFPTFDFAVSSVLTGL